MTRTLHIPDPMRALFAEVHQNTDACTRRARDDGYVCVRIPGHPFASQSTGEVLEHRLVMEKTIGRFLYPSEDVHHKNRLRNDNRIQNLELHLNRRSHMFAHSKRHDPELIEQVRQAAADPAIRICDLPISPTTTRRICLDNKIRWIAADETHLTEEQ